MATFIARVYQKTAVSDRWDFKGKETAVAPMWPPVGLCFEAFWGYADPEVWTACFLHA